MHPFINFLIRAGVIAALMPGIMVLGITLGPAEKYSSDKELRTSVITETIDHPETEPTTEPPNDYTEEDREYLALVIYQEAGGDKYTNETRFMVGTVVMNRVEDDRYPDTIHDVLTQKRQYGRLHWTGLVWPERAKTEAERHAVERAYAIAERILKGERFLPTDVIFQAEFPQGTEVVAHQDGFYFCR